MLNQLFSDSRILGRSLYDDLIPDRKLGDAVSFLEVDEREAFLDLAKGMLTWHPGARKSAGELIGHPFLQPSKKAPDFCEHLLAE